MSDDKKRTKRTKIVATLGPATSTPEMIEDLIIAGVNVFRLNFSHGTHKSHAQLIEWIKEKRESLQQPVAILQDLSGPKIRVGRIIDTPFLLEKGAEIVLDAGIQTQDGKNIPVTHAGFAHDVQEGHHLLLADGRFEVRITRVDPPKVYCEVLVGGELTTAKGINYPDGTFNVPAVTEKDKVDLRFGLKSGVDYVALSFVKTADDIRMAREICREEGRIVPIIAKIEKHEAISHFPEILDVVDGVMVARGDLGVEVPLEKVPMIQKKIINLANEQGKPVITATQMLLSMVEAPRPTRAEVTDISTAIFDGTDAIMLSDETAAGKYPLQAVQMMTKISLETERNLGNNNAQAPIRKELGPRLDIARAISRSATNLAYNLGADLMICPTNSGFTARMISRYRPKAIVVALTPNISTYYQLALLWGVEPRVLPAGQNMDQLMELAVKLAREETFVHNESLYVITAGFPFASGGPTNLIKAGMIEKK